jgi:hypothetical protein
MTNDVITKFLEPEHLAKHTVKIDFKTRGTILGIFIRMPDYDELKSKNFWRIVTETNIKQWKDTQDASLARIFNGAEMTRLSQSKS